MMAEAGADLFNRTCFNYPTLGDLYEYATYAAMLKRDGLVVHGSQPGQISRAAPFLLTALQRDTYRFIANFLLVWGRGGAAGYGTARKTVCKRNVKNRHLPTRTRDYAPASLLVASDSIN